MVMDRVGGHLEFMGFVGTSETMRMDGTGYDVFITKNGESSFEHVKQRIAQGW